jgi:pimeloyl-ACP methyl ester carboxylesterase
MQTKIITYQGSPVSYNIIGEGKPVILLHGFAENADVWHYQVDFLKLYFRLIIPDIPGSGKSPLIKNANIEIYCEAIKAIVDNELQLNPIYKTVAMIGHSLGGYITLAFAEKYPSLLNSFGLFHSTAFADTEEKKQVRIKAIEFIKTNGAYTFVKTSTPSLFTDEFKNNHSKEIEVLIESSKKNSQEAFIQYYHAMIARPERINVLKTFLKPILFIIGEKDNAVPLQSSLQQCYLSSQSHVHILQKSAHMGMWEEAEKANQILLKFLTSI